MSIVEQKLQKSSSFFALFVSFPQKTAQTGKLDKRILSALEATRIVENHSQEAMQNLSVAQEFIATSQQDIVLKEFELEDAGVACGDNSHVQEISRIREAKDYIVNTAKYLEDQKKILADIHADIDRLGRAKVKLLEAQCGGQDLVQQKILQTEQAIHEHRREDPARIRALATHLYWENRGCSGAKGRGLNLPELLAEIKNSQNLSEGSIHV